MALRENEKDKLLKQLEDVQRENEFLWVQQRSDQVCPVVSQNNGNAVVVQTPTAAAAAAAVAMSSETAPHDSSDSPDALELPRMTRKVQQLQNELRRTKTKLLNSQKTMQVGSHRFLECCCLRYMVLQSILIYSRSSVHSY